MRVIFLDIDGVLNRLKPLSNGYCGIDGYNLDNLCKILSHFPDVRIVLSSAWRYLVHNGDFSLRGFEYLLCIHGADADVIKDRIIGVTETDEDTLERLLQKSATINLLVEYGITIRRSQIRKWVRDNNVEQFIVIDDLDLRMEGLRKTDPDIGLDSRMAKEIIEKDFQNAE